MHAFPCDAGGLYHRTPQDFAPPDAESPTCDADALKPDDCRQRKGLLAIGGVESDVHLELGEREPYARSEVPLIWLLVEEDLVRAHDKHTRLLRIHKRVVGLEVRAQSDREHPGTA